MEPSRDFSRELEELITCSVCFEHYRNPRILPCHHAFCEPCLTNIGTRNNRLRCPLCTNETTLTNGITGLQADFRATQILELRKKWTTLRQKTPQQSPYIPEVLKTLHRKLTAYVEDKLPRNGGQRDILMIVGTVLVILTIKFLYTFSFQAFAVLFSCIWFVLTWLFSILSAILQPVLNICMLCFGLISGPVWFTLKMVYYILSGFCYMCGLVIFMRLLGVLSNMIPKGVDWMCSSLLKLLNPSWVWGNYFQGTSERLNKWCDKIFKRRCRQN